MAIPVSELQKVSPSSLIELFTLSLDATLHGSSTVYRFHSGANLNTFGAVVWAGNTYSKFPVEVTGFEFNGTSTTLPRPKLRISNMLSTFTELLLDINQTTPGNDLNGAKLTRIRTLARYLDNANFPNNTNNLGTPDPTAAMPEEIYYLDRKTVENRNMVEWECVAAFDLVNVKVPKRICTRDIFPGIGTFV
tara:strand:- start:165 stop:740 length:576 start_codon:yes stop_codon:yes gene_type:complete